MGVSQDDIEDLRAAVPPHLRPPEGGTSWLPNSFHAVSAQGAETTPRGSDPLAIPITSPDAQAALVETARQLDAGQIDSTSLIVPRSGIDRRLADEKRKQDKRRDDALFLTLLDRARDWSRQLGERIDTMERGFEAEKGDAWREQIANEIMDPDEIPQRRDGESMEAYRERLEDALVDKMIDPATGQIKPEYRDDPKLRSYAEWAQAKYQKRDVDAYIARRSDPSLSPAQQDAEDRKFASSATAVQLRDATIDLEARGDNSTALRGGPDDRHDKATSLASSEAAVFGVS